jgi:hypothetical protein
MNHRLWLAVLSALVLTVTPGRAVAVDMAVDISGTWTASFDTQIGRQNYTYQFAVKEGGLTGTAKSDNGEAALRDGKVDGDKVTFVELLNFQGMEIRIDYTGKITSDDEIKFTRQVADFATEELVATRVKAK